MKKLSLRTQLVLIICTVMVPLCLVVALANAVTLSNAEERLKDAYDSELKSHAWIIDNSTEKLKVEMDSFYQEYTILMSKKPPMAKLSVIHIVDELRRIWKRSDILSGAYLKLNHEEAVYLTHNNNVLSIPEGNNITKSKPDPEVFLKAAEYLGLPPKDCLVVEDAVAGAQAAHAAGMRAACVGDAASEQAGDYNLAGITQLPDVALSPA